MINSLFFPTRCMFCGKPIEDGKIICLECRATLPHIHGEICEVCGRPLTECTCKIGDFAFDRNVSLYRYDTSAKKLVLRMKYNKRVQLAVYAGKELYKLISVMYKDIDFDYITFVPMRYHNTLIRSFNQAEVMAQTISECMNVPTMPFLYKKFGMRTQKYLTAKKRRANVRGKYEIDRKLALETDLFENKTVLLVDDIMTSGATLSECALTLKNAGVKRVYCTTFALTCKK